MSESKVTDYKKAWLESEERGRILEHALKEAVGSLKHERRCAECAEACEDCQICEADKALEAAKRALGQSKVQP